MKENILLRSLGEECCQSSPQVRPATYINSYENDVELNVTLISACLILQHEKPEDNLIQYSGELLVSARLSVPAQYKNFQFERWMMEGIKHFSTHESPWLEKNWHQWRTESCHVEFIMQFVVYYILIFLQSKHLPASTLLFLMPEKRNHCNGCSVMHWDVWQACAYCGVAGRPHSEGDEIVSLSEVETTNLGKRWKGTVPKVLNQHPWLPPVVSF